MKVLFLIGLISAAGWGVEPTSPLQYKNYPDSKFEFRKKCEDQKMECGSFRIPSTTDQELTIDTAYAHDAKSSRLFVLVCGTHGAEAPVGCALLNSFLSTQAQQMRERGVSLLFVHAANPYGFQFSQRVTEANIDLNRNFMTGDRPKNEGYQKLKTNLEPEGKAGHTVPGFLKLSIQMIWRLITRDFTLPEMRQAVASGQYDSPKGMFFGGEKPEPQMEFFGNLFAKTYKDHREIVLVDIHTGLGKRGVMHLMPTDEPSEGAKQLLARIFPSGDGDKTTFELTLSNAKGFYKTFGSFCDFAQQAASPGQTVLALTMEFGTLGDGMVSQLRSLNRMVMENQGRQFGYTSESNQYRVKNDYMELFAPSSPEWQSEVNRKASDVLSLINKNL